MIKFEQLYLIVDKMFREIEQKLAYDKNYNHQLADADVKKIYDLIISLGWTIDDFNRQMVMSSFKKINNNAS